ncbi:MAG TPA: hypothetical protein VGG13_04030 [Candidatus Saccharimonadales bacterium]|jgi:hypothetical protein
MTKCYLELRGSIKRGGLDLAADLARHLHTRQYLGKTIVVCERPSVLLPNVHKQWLRLSRTIQKQRAGTANADKILKYTRTITHMQHMRFVACTPLEAPDADVYFLRRNQLESLPMHCFNVYLSISLPTQTALDMLAHLPAEALLVDYDHGTPWRSLNVAPKRELEEQVTREWHAARTFLDERHIQPEILFGAPLHNVEAVDNALDTLLGVSHQFLQVAAAFNRSLELARPLRITKTTRQHYDTLTLLAHRVQALSTASFTPRFLETYNEDDTFYLYDSGRIYFRRASSLGFESLTEAVTRHLAAGRHNLAQVLRTGQVPTADFITPCF